MNQKTLVQSMKLWQLLEAEENEYWGLPIEVLETLTNSSPTSVGRLSDDIYFWAEYGVDREAPHPPSPTLLPKFVLVQGEGFGAWCWYKIIGLMEESGFSPVAIDLSRSGINLADTNAVATLYDYAKPLFSDIQKSGDDEKIILVGHGYDGLVISYCMENYPTKISKAVFICATMLSIGQRPLDYFREEFGSAEEFMQELKLLIYGNGTKNPPTCFMLEKEQMKSLYFNLCTTKDISLAMVSMRAVPLGPIMERLCLTPDKYGATRRFYVQSLENRALSPYVQEQLVMENPPEEVLIIEASDHYQFFSNPQSLHNILLEIAHKP